MITAPVGVELRPLTIPASIDSPDAADFIEMVRRAQSRLSRDLAATTTTASPRTNCCRSTSPTSTSAGSCGSSTVDGEMVGRVGVDLPLEGDSKLAFWLIELVRDVWGRGIGSAAYDARRADRARERPHGPAVVGRAPRCARVRDLAAPTGFGTIPDDHAARFYRAARLHARADRAQQRVRSARPVRRRRSVCWPKRPQRPRATASCSGSRRRRRSSSTATRG